MDMSSNKIIPAPYRDVILQALLFYPELENEHIEFRPVKFHVVPYATAPAATSIFRRAQQRKYVVFLKEESRGPEVQALFRNLPPGAQVGIIAHELGHVVQYRSLSAPRLALMLLLYGLPPLQKRIESGADKQAIAHGAGEHLLEWATFIRRIPGYMKQSPRHERYYLKPGQIEELTKRLNARRT